MLSLAEQHQWYIVKHIEKFLVSVLCYQLVRDCVNSRYLPPRRYTVCKGIDMADLWNFFPLGNYIYIMKRMKCKIWSTILINEMGRARFHKAILYGAVIGGYFGLSQGCYVGQSFLLQQQIVKFLYGIL